VLIDITHGEVLEEASAPAFFDRHDLRPLFLLIS
jgi:hypothetical protein